MRNTLFLWFIGLCAISACELPDIDGDKAETSNLAISHKLKLLEDEKNSTVMVVAHRACHQNAPENSLQAIERCIELGVDMIEFDVRLTRDQKLVVVHDETLGRTTNGSGRVADYTLTEIQALRLKNRAGDNENLTEFHPPSLEEALLTAKDKILINLDLKESLFDQAYDVVKKTGVEDQILMKMNAAPDSPKLREASFIGKVHFMPIMFECTPFYNVYCVQTLSDSVSAYQAYDPIAYEIVFQSDDFLAEGIQKMEQHGARIWVNTMIVQHAAGKTGKLAVENPEENWGELIRLGANIIQTDYPEELMAFLNDQNLRDASSDSVVTD